MSVPSNEAFRSLVERAADVMLLLDAAGTISYCNPAAERLFGRPLSELVGEHFGNLATSEQHSEIYILHPRRGLVAADVRRASVELAGSPLMAVYLRDITERVQEEERLRQYAAIFNAISEGVMITTPDTEIIAVNRAFTSITGYSQDEAVGRTPEFLRSTDQDPVFYEEIRRILEREGRWEGELRKRRKNGETYLEQLSINTVRRDDGEVICYVAVFADVTGVDNLRHRADHDALTQLYNRYAFETYLQAEISRAGRYGGSFSLIMFDLDRFKSVNDRYGHDVGDRVLRRVATLAGQALRDADILARWGGEEFMVLMPETDIDNAGIVAERLRSRIAQSDFEGAGRITVSLGIAASQAGESGEALVRRVDRALYQAKRSGRNRSMRSRSSASADQKDAEPSRERADKPLMDGCRSPEWYPDGSQ